MEAFDGFVDADWSLCVGVLMQIVCLCCVFQCLWCDRSGGLVVGAVYWGGEHSPGLQKQRLLCPACRHLC